MASSKDGMSYRERVQLFAQQFCEKYDQKTFSIETGVPESTISQTLNQPGGFGSKTHRTVVHWIESVAADLFERGMPLKLDDLELSLRPEFLDKLRLSTATSEDEKSQRAAAMSDEASASEASIPQVNADEEAPANDGDKTGTEGAIQNGVTVPAGVSILRSELRGRTFEMWDRSELFADDLVSSDLERVFAVSLSTPSDMDDPFLSWIGPSPPEDLEFILDEQMYEELVNLLRHWQQYAFAYQICKGIPRFANHFAFLYIRRRMLEIEAVLIEDFWMTHPDAEIPWQDFQRLRELEWRYEEIPQLQSVEYHTNLEILVLATIKIGKFTFAIIAKPVAWVFRRLFRGSHSHNGHGAYARRK